MDLGSLRALALSLNFDTHGVPATLTPPNEAPVVTRVIWVTPATDLEPPGSEFGRREPIRILAIRRAALDRVPRGTVIVAPAVAGGADETWKVDGTDRIEADHQRVIVVPMVGAS
jgi:hypothetical protein